jgi:hypothetical protein
MKPQSRWPRRSRARARCSAFVLLLVASQAHAQSDSFSLPPQCGTPGEFRQGLTRLLGAEAERAWPVSLLIAQEPTTGWYRLRLELQAGPRELQHADCRVLFRSALVIAAATVDPTVRLDEGSEPAGAPALTRTPPPAHAAAAKTTHASSRSLATPAPGPAERQRIETSIAAGTAAALGLLPGASLALELRGGISAGALGALVTARYYAPSSTAASGRTVVIQGAGLRAAAAFSPSRLVELSLGVAADWLVGQGRAGIADPRQDSAWALAPSLELALVPLRSSSFSLELAAEGRWNLERPVFEVTGFREVYTVPEVGLLTGARGVWHFP